VRAEASHRKLRLGNRLTAWSWTRSYVPLAVSVWECWRAASTYRVHQRCPCGGDTGYDLMVVMGEEDLTPAQRSLRAKLAAHTSWANTADRAARTAAARKAANERFARQVDPDGTLPPQERAERAENARKAYFTALALRSTRARGRRRTAGGEDSP
jgi:hypothetical protein